MGDVCIWRIFYEAVINPFVWQKPRDKEKIARVVAEELPEVMAYLERLAPAVPRACESCRWLASGRSSRSFSRR